MINKLWYCIVYWTLKKALKTLVQRFDVEKPFSYRKASERTIFLKRIKSLKEKKSEKKN